MIRMYRQTANVMISLIGGLRETARQIINKNGEEMAHANLHKMTKFVEGDQTGDGYHYVQPWLADQLIDVSRQHIGKDSTANQVMRYIAIHDWEARFDQSHFDICEYARRSLAHMLFAVGQGYVTTHEFVDLDDDIQSTGKYEREVSEVFAVPAQDCADAY